MPAPIIGRLQAIGIAPQTATGSPATNPTVMIPFDEAPDFLELTNYDVTVGIGRVEQVRDSIVTALAAKGTLKQKLSMDLFPYFAQSAFGDVSSALDTGVVSVPITTAGTGYTSQPTLSTTGGGGTGAVFDAYLKLVSGTVTAGSGYTNGTYAVTFTGGQVPRLPDGSAPRVASATITVSGGVLTTFTILDAGTGYIQPPKISFSAGAGTGGGITAVMGVGQVFVMEQGNGFTSAPTINTTGGGGTGVVFGTVVVSTSTTGYVNSFTIRQSTNLPRLTIFLDYGVIGKWRVSDAIVSKLMADLANDEVAMLEMDMLGADVQEFSWTEASIGNPTYFIRPYMRAIIAPTVTALTTYSSFATVTSTTGSGFKGIPVVLAGKIVAVNIISGGLGYTSGDTIAFTGTTGSGATGTLVIENGTITDVIMTNEGVDYTGNPIELNCKTLTFEIDSQGEQQYTTGTQNLSPAFVLAKARIGNGKATLIADNKYLRRANLENIPFAFQIKADNKVKLSTNSSRNAGLSMVLSRVFLKTKMNNGLDDIVTYEVEMPMTYDGVTGRSVAMETFSNINLS